MTATRTLHVIDVNSNSRAVPHTTEMKRRLQQLHLQLAGRLVTRRDGLLRRKGQARALLHLPPSGVALESRTGRAARPRPCESRQSSGTRHRHRPVPSAQLIGTSGVPDCDGRLTALHCRLQLASWLNLPLLRREATRVRLGESRPDVPEL